MNSVHPIPEETVFWSSPTTGDTDSPPRALSTWVHGWYNAILRKPVYHEVPRGAALDVEYREWSPIQLHLGNAIWSNSLTLTILSQLDLARLYPGHGINTPFIVLDPSCFNLLTERWFRGIRKDISVVLWRETDSLTLARFDLLQNTFLSRFHCELIAVSSSCIRVRDVGSSNGTWVTTVTTVHSVTEKREYLSITQAKINTDLFLKTLWPDLAQGMRQWPVGNCYFVAAMNAIKEHPEAFELLKKMVQSDTQGWYTVQFRGIQQYTHISQSDIDAMWRNKLRGSLGDLILERAYWRLRDHKYDPNLRGGFTENIPRRNHTLVAVNYNGDKMHEGWWMKDVLKDFLWDLVSLRDFTFSKYGVVWPTVQADFLNAIQVGDILTTSSFSVKTIQQNCAKYPDTQFAVFSKFFSPLSDTFKESEKTLKGMNKAYDIPSVHREIARRIQIEDISGDRQNFSIKDIKGRDCKFYFCHAYSIGEVNKNGGYIEVINPHDTVHARYMLRISDFVEYFHILTIARRK